MTELYLLNEIEGFEGSFHKKKLVEKLNCIAFLPHGLG